MNGFYPPVVRHTCDNIKCINPLHLIAGDYLDNIKDRHERGRTHNQCFPEVIQNVFDLREKGFRYKEIADKLNISYKKVDYILYKYKVEEGQLVKFVD